MREEGWLIGYGPVTALCDVPALERIHGSIRAARSQSPAAWAVDITHTRPGIVIEIS